MDTILGVIPIVIFKTLIDENSLSAKALIFILHIKYKHIITSLSPTLKKMSRNVTTLLILLKSFYLLSKYVFLFYIAICSALHFCFYSVKNTYPFNTTIVVLFIYIFMFSKYNYCEKVF